MIDTPVSTKINKTFWFDKNHGFFCGGKKSLAGYIYRTQDGGQQWDKVYVSNSVSLYDIYFINDSLGFCCGENMTILSTSDAGKTWQSTNNKNADDFYNGTLRGIFGNKDLLFFVGGKNFNIGIINRYINGKEVIGFKGINNEMRSGFSFNLNNYLVCGYGTSYQSTDKGKFFNPTNITDEFYTSCTTLNNSTGFACGYNGGIYKVTQAGGFSKKLYDHNRFYKKKINFTGIVFISETQGWVSGNEGFLYQTNDGSSFKKVDLKTSSDFLSVVLNHNNQLIVSTGDGKLIKVPF